MQIHPIVLKSGDHSNYCKCRECSGNATPQFMMDDSITTQAHESLGAAISPEHRAYEATPQFRMYLAEKARWEAAHAEYGRNPHTRNQLTIREHAMRVCLERARNTPEHKAVWGW